jgi:hypothetical protein
MRKGGNMDDETWELVKRHKEAAYSEGYFTGVIHTVLATLVVGFIFYKAFW